MTLQIQMNTIDEAGTATPMYPINRTSDVIVGAFAAASKASLPGESANETLATSLELIKAYLKDLKNAAYMNIAEELGNDAESVPTTAMVYDAVKNVKTALQTTGGEMSGYLSFETQSNSTGATAGLKFKCIQGSVGSQSEHLYEIRAISYTTPGGGGTINGGLGCSTIIPLDSADTLGHGSKKWAALHVDTIYGFNLSGDINPARSMEFSLGSSTNRFENGYFTGISLKDPTYQYDDAVLSATCEQYDRYDWRECFTVNSSIIPLAYKSKLGEYSHPWYDLYTNSITLYRDNEDSSTAFSMSYWGSFGIHYDSTSSKTTTAGVSMSNSSLGLSIDADRFDLYTKTSFLSNREMTIYSDNKIKNFTENLDSDAEKLLKLFDDVKIKSYIYKYETDQLTESIGLSAQELEELFIKYGLDPFKYNVLNVRYNYMMHRGNDDEDMKFYSKFMTVSYSQLNTLAIMKLQEIGKELDRIKTEHVTEIDRLKAKTITLESKLSAIEARLG